MLMLLIMPTTLTMTVQIMKRHLQYRIEQRISQHSLTRPPCKAPKRNAGASYVCKWTYIHAILPLFTLFHRKNGHHKDFVSEVSTLHCHLQSNHAVRLFFPSCCMFSFPKRANTENGASRIILNQNFLKTSLSGRKKPINYASWPLTHTSMNMLSLSAL